MAFTSSTACLALVATLISTTLPVILSTNNSSMVTTNQLYKTVVDHQYPFPSELYEPTALTNPQETKSPTAASSQLEPIRIGFLPALTANKGQSKHYVGAFKYALIDINQQHKKLGYPQLVYQVHDTRADVTESLRGMTAMYMNGTAAFIGPEDTCAIQARLAAAWNLPIFSFKCRDSVVSNKAGLYPTFIRTIPSTSKVCKSVVAMMKHFKWKTFQAIVGNNTIWNEAASTLRTWAEAESIAMNPDKHFQEPYIGPDEMPLLVDATYKKTRIYVFLGDHHALIDFVRAIHAHNFNNGEYVVLAVSEAPYDSDPINKPKYFRKYLEALEDLEEYMVDAFRSVLMLFPSEPTNPRYTEFLDQSRDYSYKPPFNAPKPPYPELKLQVPIFASYLYDAVHLYARSLREVLAEGGNPRNGTALVAKLIRRTYLSIQGHQMFIDINGNAEANYTVVALLPDDKVKFGRSLQPVGSFITHYWKLPDFSYTYDIEWISGLVSEPECGFDGAKCEFNAEWPIVGICVVTASIIAIAVVFACRHYIYEQKLSSLLWKIDKKELLTFDLEFDHQMADNQPMVQHHLYARLRNQSWESIGRIPSSGPKRIEIATYKGSMVAVKVRTMRHIEMTRAVKKELYMMKELSHDNLNRFIGASIESPLVYIVMHFCSRGSLKDILENEDIHLDDMFIASLVFDLIKGMIYLHESPIISHGNLKPSNCLVDSRWVLQISDFGLNHLKARSSSCINDRNYHAEKLLWQAPELLRSFNSTPRGTQKGDVYSFGLILYEMHGRQGPWGPNPPPPAEIIERLMKVTESVPYRPNTSDVKCTDLVNWCIQDCWSEDPEQRPDFKYIRQRLKPLQQGLSSNIFDNMLAIMEKYANRLEFLVDERTNQLAEEKKKTETLLLTMLPKTVAEQLMRNESVIPEQYECVTIYLSDIVSFTSLSANSTPMEVVDMLNDLYTLFDSIIGHYDVYKVETIGDAYMVVSGLPIRNVDKHAGEIASMSLHLLHAIRDFKIRHLPHETMKLRIGIHSGPVVAGVVGLKMPRYCLFGDTVNTASRLESTGEPFKVHLSSNCKQILDRLGGYQTEPRGMTSMKGRGEMFTYFLVGEDSRERLRRITEEHSTRLEPPSTTSCLLSTTPSTVALPNSDAANNTENPSHPGNHKPIEDNFKDIDDVIVLNASDDMSGLAERNEMPLRCGGDFTTKESPDESDPNVALLPKSGAWVTWRDVDCDVDKIEQRQKWNQSNGEKSGHVMPKTMTETMPETMTEDLEKPLMGRKSGVDAVRINGHVINGHVPLLEWHKNYEATHAC